MPVPSLRPSSPIDLATHLGTEGEEDYAQLVMMLRETQESFALMPVWSDLSVPARDALLRRLEKDLAPIPLRSVQLRRETSREAALLIARAAAGLPGPQGVVVLLGRRRVLLYPGDKSPWIDVHPLVIEDEGFQHASAVPSPIVTD